MVPSRTFHPVDAAASEARALALVRPICPPEEYTHNDSYDNTIHHPSSHEQRQSAMEVSQLFDQNLYLSTMPQSRSEATALDTASAAAQEPDELGSKSNTHAVAGSSVLAILADAAIKRYLETVSDEVV